MQHNEPMITSEAELALTNNNDLRGAENRCRAYNAPNVADALQYVAMCCNVLRCVAVCCSVLQFVAVHFSVF